MPTPPHTPPPYSRLPGEPRIAWMSRARCWRGADHLLYVETSWFVERYRRFGFRDIESITIQRNGRARSWTLMWAVILLLGAALALPPAAAGAVRVIGAILAIPALLGLAINALRGPCCTVTIQTRVSRQRIRAWRRIRTARRAVAEIAAIVEAVQGSFSDEAYAAALSGGPPSDAGILPPAGPAPAPPPPLAQPPPPSGTAGTRWHRLNAAVLLAESAAAAAAIGLRTAPMLMGVLALSFLLFALCTVALVRGASGRAPRILRVWAWWLFAYVAVRGAVAYFWGLARYMAAAATGQGQPDDWVVLFFDSWAADSRFLAVFFGAVCLVSATLGVLGLLLARYAARRAA